MGTLTAMTSKFNGKCFRCSSRILAGSPILWSKQTGAKHNVCPPAGTAEAVVAKPKRIPTTELGDFTAVYLMFESAAKTNKFPKISISADGFEFLLYVSGPKAKIAGVINVRGGGGYANAPWYGRITQDGTWTHKAGVDERMADALCKLQLDPVTAVATFGKLSGRCCFCNIELTTDNSLAAGYGPICAKKWCLPWGKKAKASKFQVADAKIEAAVIKAATTGSPMVMGPMEYDENVAWGKKDTEIAAALVDENQAVSLGAEAKDLTAGVSMSGAVTGEIIHSGAGNDGSFQVVPKAEDDNSSCGVPGCVFDDKGHAWNEDAAAITETLCALCFSPKPQGKTCPCDEFGIEFK